MTRPASKDRASGPREDPDGLLPAGSEEEYAVICCLCGGKPHVGDNTCPMCILTYRRVREVLRRHPDSHGGNPIWILGGALACVIGPDNVDWDAVHRMAAEFEMPYGIH